MAIYLENVFIYFVGQRLFYICALEVYLAIAPAPVKEDSEDMLLSGMSPHRD